MKTYFTLLILFIASVFTYGQSPDSITVKTAIDSLKKTAPLLVEEGDIAGALKALEEAEAICGEAFGENVAIYAELLTLKAWVFFLQQDIQQAENCSLRSLEILKQTEGNTHPFYIENLLYLMDINYGKGDYERARENLAEAIPLMEKSWGKENPQTLQYKLNMGVLYRETGQFDKAERTILETAASVEQAMGRESPHYASCLVNLGQLYSDMGNYEKAEKVFLEAKDLYDTHLNDRESGNYLFILQNMGILYWEMKDYEKAEPMYLASLPVFEKLMGKDNPEYAGALINLGLLYTDMDRYKEAEPLFREAKTIFEEKLQNTEHPYYLNCLHNLANCYFATGKHEAAEQLNLQTLSTREKTLGKNHEDYAQSLENLIRLYLKTGSYDQAEIHALAMLDNLRYRIRTAFSFLSENEKEKFILSKISGKVQLLQSTGMKIQSPGIRDLEYDLALMVKGLRLQTGRSTMEYVLKQKDPTALETYDQLLQIREKLAALYDLPANERSGIAQLEEEQEKLEKILARLSATFRKNRDAGRISCNDVRATLKKGEAAIEFVHFNDSAEGAADSVRYAAVLLLSGEEHARFIPLFVESQLNELLKGETERRLDYIDNLYTFSDRGATSIEEEPPGLFELIWQPLQSHLEGVEKIHYAPGGLLHRINIGAIPLDEESTVADKFSLQALSSTRELALRKKDTPVPAGSERGASIFGGIQYNYDSISISQSLQALNLPVRSSNEEDMEAYASRSARGGAWKYLKWTKKETEKIRDILQTSGYQVTLLNEYNALEESFKLISIQSVSPHIIHLATHGYFFPDPVRDDSSSEQEVSEHPMIRSGLILAGANRAWTGGALGAGQDDGILTAFEISQMNLTNTELVVLSACETGLGDIRDNEGVFGLQRAFKMAGARYIIMSLWQVPDFQTQDLMTTFYQKLLEEEMSIPVAFREAQLEMREKYMNPYFWAGFVLIE